MSQTETSYFTLRPCDKEVRLIDPKPDPLKDLSISSANAASVDTGYLHELGLPSLPPLSHLLTDDGKALSTPVSVVQAMVQAQQQHDFTTHSSSPSASSISPVHTSLAMIAPEPILSVAPSEVSTMGLLMDPTMYLSPPQNELTVNTTSPSNAAATLMSTTHPFYTLAPSSPPASFMIPSSNEDSMDPRDSVEKNYSFVAIPGAYQRKRPRRRYDEIERLYHCTWPNCTKSYGTLNHLNAHVSMQKHVSLQRERQRGRKRNSSFFVGSKTPSLRIQGNA